MAKINVTSGTASAYGQGELQLQNKAPMDGTLRFVTDSANTASPLLLSTSEVQVQSTLRITTNDNPYIDAEDGATNNRFTVGRAPASQQVNVDFASNPSGSTTVVGAIRTYVDGVNLSEVMTFREDGNVGINTLTPGAKLDVHSASNVIAQFNRTGSGKAWTQYLLAGAAKWNTGFDNTNGNYTIYDAVNATDSMVVTNTGNVGIGTATPGNRLHVFEGSSGATNTGSTLRVENSGSSNAFFIFQTATSGGGNCFNVTNAGNVGIGTTTPQFKLEVSGDVGGYQSGLVAYKTYSKIAGFQLSSYQSVNGAPYTKTTDLVANADSSVGSELRILTAPTASNPTEVTKFTSDGYLRMASGTGGIQFNGDTAAANALDDYEEGTFTPTFTGSTTNPTITYAAQLGRYTKIGRQVTVSIELGTSANSGGVGDVWISGLPFVVGVRTYTAVATFNIDNSRPVPMGIFAELNGGASYAAFLSTGDNTTWAGLNWTDATNSTIYINATFTYFV